MDVIMLEMGGELMARRSDFMDELVDIHDLLIDIAEADSDSPWSQPAIPADKVPPRLQRLMQQLRLLFELEENEKYLAEISDHSPELRVELERLNADHQEIADLLERIFELSGSSLHPTSSWDDIERHYRGFKRRLANHQRNEERLLRKAGLAEA